MQVAIVEGVGREGAPGPSVLESLYNTAALAQYLVVHEVPCTPHPPPQPAKRLLLHAVCPGPST